MLFGMAELGTTIICAKDGCGESFTVTHHRQKYCPTHRTKPNKERYRYLREDEQWYQEKGYCQRQGCQKKIRGKRARTPNVKYCSEECSKIVFNQKQAERKRIKARQQDPTAAKQWAEVGESQYARKGEVYEKLKSYPDLVTRLDDGDITQAGIAELLGHTEAAVSRALEAIRYDLAVAEQQGKWKMPRLTRAMLPVEALRELKRLGRDPRNEDTPRFQELLDYLVRAHVAFSRRYFTLEHERPIITDFHKVWIRSLLVAYAIGGKQLILSPPRHGKSEVLIRFVTWLVVMDPDIRVMWVCANEKVAKMMLGSVKDHLENNEPLLAAVLPPGEKFKPGWGSGKPWSSTEIKVEQNKSVGQKSSTLLALGRTSKILSRDVDFLIVDDLEDYDTTREPGQRQYSRNKFVEIGTRKQPRTAWINIGSRQHPEDLGYYLLKNAKRDGWRVLEYSAHDLSCDKDPEDTHAHWNCMLFPEVAPYSWLMEKKHESEMLGLPGMWEMRYLNKPIPTQGIVFDVPQIRELVDRSRGIGLEGLPEGGILYAGLDPSPRNVQAAFLWYYVNQTIYMVDLEEQKAGGFAGALDVMERWHEQYGCSHWFYEDNSQQIEFFRDPRLRKLKNETGITVKPHNTGKNKIDPELGISSMAPFFHNGTINLPYGTPDARAKVETYLRQLELWTTDGVRKGAGLTDVKMASWFPFPRLIRRMKVDTVQSTIETPREASYPTYAAGNRPGWRTRYPKR